VDRRAPNNGGHFVEAGDPQRPRANRAKHALICAIIGTACTRIEQECGIVGGFRLRARLDDAKVSTRTRLRRALCCPDRHQRAALQP
jgi:hypothetical protein